MKLCGRGAVAVDVELDVAGNGRRRGHDLEVHQRHGDGRPSGADVTARSSAERQRRAGPGAARSQRRRSAAAQRLTVGSWGCPFDMRTGRSTRSRPPCRGERRGVDLLAKASGMRGHDRGRERVADHAHVHRRGAIGLRRRCGVTRTLGVDNSGRGGHVLAMSVSRSSCGQTGGACQELRELRDVDRRQVARRPCPSWPGRSSRHRSCSRRRSRCGLTRSR